MSWVHFTSLDEESWKVDGKVDIGSSRVQFRVVFGVCNWPKAIDDLRRGRERVWEPALDRFDLRGEDEEEEEGVGSREGYDKME